MKIQVLVQGERWLNRAGVRIRYRRIAPHLLPLGSSLTVDVIGPQVNRDRVGADVVILSKCSDARGVAIAEALREQGVIVGVDLFDDYFSTRTSPCLSHRQMLRDMAGRVDFFLCSTARMKQVGLDFAPDMPVHVLNDPLDGFDRDALAQRLSEKAERALSDRSFEVLWFGNGDNPVFPVGLADLAAFGSSLRSLADGRFDVSLNILTNLRALNVANLARLRNLPLPVTMKEWSEEDEREQLEEALVSFIPVNFQNFSIAKSLNRGVSALTGGTQVLSPGYQLYGTLGAFTYSDPGRLLDDLAAGTLKLRPDTLNALERQMDDLADPAAEAAKLNTFMRGLEAARSTVVRARRGHHFSRAILHGSETSRAVHNFCQRLGWLSIASPFTTLSAPCDVHVGFVEGEQEPQVRISRDSLKFLRPEWRAKVEHSADPGDPYPGRLPIPDVPGANVLRRLRPSMIATRPGRILHYARVMKITEDVIGHIFEDMVLTRSEQEAPLISLKPVPAAEMAAR